MSLSSVAVFVTILGVVGLVVYVTVISRRSDDHEKMDPEARVRRAIIALAAALVGLAISVTVAQLQRNGDISTSKRLSTDACKRSQVISPFLARYYEKHHVFPHKFTPPGSKPGTAPIDVQAFYEATIPKVC